MSKYLSEYNCNIIYPKIEHDKLTDKKKISLYSEILYWIKNAYNSIFYFDDPMIYNQYLDECFRFYKKVMCSDDSYIKENYKSQLQEFENNFNEAITFLKGKNISIPKVDLPLDEELMCTMEWPKVKAEGDDVNGEVEGGEKPRKKEAKPEGQAVLSGERGSPESSGQTVIEESENGRSGLAEAGGLGDQEEGSRVQESEEGPTVPKKPQMLHHGGENDLISDGTMVRGIDGETSESILPKNVGTIGATLAGSSIFLLMMYKYTPLGSWVSTKILGRNKLMENMRKNNYELLLNEVGNHEASLNDTMYHISYNSSSNQ
ncbi:Plasmodium vivax Vir protein, putative [Plasmodium vivax]|uniref:Vir protein, putative n=1 Tax=Plasmodium vivax TaxID=5855 RepID=A0A1G4EC50_PLAVI|nr:Plasmodium vivax Vir protein, putative [Plasmodium vivax]